MRKKSASHQLGQGYKHTLARLRKCTSKRKREGYLFCVQRLEACRAMHDCGPQCAPSRRSFVNSELLLWISISVFAGIVKILGTEMPLKTDKSPTTYLLSTDQIASIVKQELNMTLSEEHRMRSLLQTKEVKQEGTFAIVEVVQEKICDESHAFCRDPLSRIQKGYATASDAMNWFRNYRLSAEEIKKIDPAKIDCNDNSACELLSAYGLPMYIISMYPKNLKHRFDHSWHQFAACKLNENVFLIVDGNQSMIWYGTMQQYVEENGSRDTQSEIIPVVGISRYAEPFLRNPLSKFEVQALNGICSEEEMIPYYQSTQHSLVDSQ